MKGSFSGGFLINIQDKSVTNHNVLCWSFLSSVLLSGVFSGFRIAVSKTIHTELARSGSGVRRHCEKYNNHQISLVKCSALTKCRCLQSVPMMLADKTCHPGQQEAPKPDIKKVSALEKHPSPHHLLIFSHSSFIPRPQGIMWHRQSFASPKDSALLLAGCLFPRPTSRLLPHASNVSSSLAYSPVSAGATPHPTGPVSHRHSHTSIPPAPQETRHCCISAGILAL